MTTKTPEEIDQYIHEAMRGLEHGCCHKWQSIEHGQEGRILWTLLKCNKCGTEMKVANPVVLNMPSYPAYLTHNPAWTKMVEWALLQEWWWKFIKHTISSCEFEDLFDDTFNTYKHSLELGADVMVKLFADPPALATAITEFLEEADREHIK